MKNSFFLSARSKKILLFFVFFCLFLIFNFNSFNKPLVSDEGEYAYSAWLMHQGVLPYQSSFIQKPPMIIYIYWLAYLISPDAYWTSRLLGFIFTIFTIFLIGAIAKKEYGEKAGWLAMLIAISMLSLPFLDPFAANTEKFMLLPLMGLLTIYLFSKKRGGLPWFMAGICSTLALLFKPIALLVIIFIFIVWLTELWLATRSFKILFKNIFWAAIGTALVSIIVLLPFLIRDHGQSIWECVVKYNGLYVKLLFEEYGLNPFLTMIKCLISIWYIFLILLIWFIIKRPARWWFYLTLLLTSLLTIAPAPMTHYYLLIVPWLAIISSERISLAIKKMENKLKKWQQKAGIIIIIFFILWPSAKQLLTNSQEIYKKIYSSSFFNEAPVVAREIQRVTSPNDRIFIIDSAPGVYYYAKRRGSSRFITFYQLALNTPLKRDYQQQVINDLKIYPPKIILLTGYQKLIMDHDQTNSTPLISYLHSLLNNDYKIIDSYLKDGDKYYQTENLSEEQKATSTSIIIFKKII